MSIHRTTLPPLQSFAHLISLNSKYDTHMHQYESGQIRSIKNHQMKMVSFLFLLSRTYTSSGSSNTGSFSSSSALHSFTMFTPCLFFCFFLSLFSFFCSILFFFLVASSLLLSASNFFLSTSSFFNSLSCIFLSCSLFFPFCFLFPFLSVSQFIFALFSSFCLASFSFFLLCFFQKLPVFIS